MMDLPNIPESTIYNLIAQLQQSLDKTGIYYRLFSRIKSPSSFNKKLTKKRTEKGDSYLLQDLVGIRIVLYFLDDIDICDKLINETFKVDLPHCNISKPSKNTFNAIVYNYVCQLPNDIVQSIGENIFVEYPIDKTFEIQIRTVFSEGWHEIEHDLRYKMEDAWKNHENSERTLNGIMATLETCNWSIIALFDDLAYQNYKSEEWEYMIRNKYRLHFSGNTINTELKDLMNNKENELAKKIFRIKREFVIPYFRKGIPLELDNLIYVVCYLEKLDSLLTIPKPIKKILES